MPPAEAGGIPRGETTMMELLRGSPPRKKDSRVVRTLYVFNLTRQSFLSLGTRPADTAWTRLRGLLGKLSMRSDEGVWVVPSKSIHTIGLFFPIDVVYLDSEMRVIHLIESLGPLRIAPIRRQCASVLELPPRTIFGSGTQVGDQLVICTPEEMYERWERSSGEQSPAGAV